MISFCISLLLLLDTTFVQIAHADGQNADITLIQPNFSSDGIIGIPHMTDGTYGYLRYGYYASLVRDPLVFYENNIDQGAVVARRFLNTMGMEFDFSDRMGLHASIPVALQWASEVPSLSRNGLGLGDIKAGIYGNLWENDLVDISGRLDVFMPTSTDSAWLGEKSPRINTTIQAHHQWQGFDVFAQTGLHFRSPVNTSMDFVLDNEWLLDVGGRWNLWEDKYALTTSYHSRHGINSLFRGGAENSSEIVTAVQKHKNKHQTQLGISKGISSGYGSSEFQVFIGYTMYRPPVEPIEERIYIPPPEDPPVVIDDPIIEETIWEPEQLAKIEENQIIIRDDIQFVVGTAEIIESSRPTVAYIAQLINSDVQIGHLVIEGHASEEGTHEYNYDLSNLRARAIFRALIEAGVHPDRLSYRGYGEAMPKNLGSDEAALAENRRVEFHIVRQDPPETLLELRELRSAPWADILLKLVIPTPKEKTPTDESKDYEGDVFTEPSPSTPDAPTQPENPTKPEETGEKK